MVQTDVDRRGRAARPAGAAPAVAGPRARSATRPAWERRYAVALVALDGVLVVVATFLALQVRFAGQPGSIETAGTSLAYGVVAAAFVPVWLVLLIAGRCYEARFLGTGSEEFKRVLNATVRFTAVVGLTAFLLRVQLSRGFVATVLPLGLVLLLLGRFAARKQLHRLRARGRALHRCVVVGTREEVVALTGRTRAEPFAGLEVVAACLPDWDREPLVLDGAPLRLLGPAREVVGRLAEVDADCLAVAGNTALSSRELRELAWELEGTGIDLTLAPGLTDVAGPRVQVRPVAGLPLLHVEEPTFSGVRKLVKGSIDLFGCLVLLVALAPLLLVVAAMVRREDGGPVFYRQERVGRDGRIFRIWKFRTMRVGADRERAELLGRNEHDGPLFKIRDDPRLTRTGAWLRRHSLDELPQLLNVLFGTMSLVGPRPPLQSEVDDYDTHVHRRLLVEPGMTGLWQINGRSDLPWSEAVRLDLYYVENWSVLMDVMILWKTVAAVRRGSGAY